MLNKYKLSKKEWRVQRALGLLKSYEVNIVEKHKGWAREVQAVSKNSAIGKFIESMEDNNYCMDEVKYYTVELIDD